MACRVGESLNVVVAGSICEVRGQCGPVVVGADAGVDLVEEVVEAGGVGAVALDGVGAVVLQHVLDRARGHRILWRAGEASIGVLDPGGGPEHGNFCGQGGVGRDQGLCPARRGVGGPSVGLFADLRGQLLDKAFAAAQVVAPLRVAGERVGDGGQPAQRPAVAAGGTGGVDAVVEHRGRVGGIVEAALCVGGGQQFAGIVTGERPDGQVAAQHGPRCACTEIRMY